MLNSSILFPRMKLDLGFKFSADSRMHWGYNCLPLVPLHSYNGPNLVLKYDKQMKRLINIAVDNRSSPFYALRDRQGNAIGVTACDIDGDGREEIYVLNTNNAFSGKKTQRNYFVITQIHRVCAHTSTSAGYNCCLVQRQRRISMQIWSLSHWSLHQITKKLWAAINQSERHGAHTAKTAAAHLYHFYNNSCSTFLTFSHSILFSCFQSPVTLVLHNNFFTPVCLHIKVGRHIQTSSLSSATDALKICWVMTLTNTET